MQSNDDPKVTEIFVPLKKAMRLTRLSEMQLRKKLGSFMMTTNGKRHVLFFKDEIDKLTVK